MKKITLLLCASLISCATHNASFVADDLPTMKAVFEQQFHSEGTLQRADVARAIHEGDDGWNPQVKNTLRPLRSEFAYLPNPVLTMYIFPHLTDAGTPVPGYTTFFRFYEQDQVGLPSELYQRE